jgi:multiple sugar transport system permease protein
MMDATVGLEWRPRQIHSRVGRLFDSKPFLVTLCLLPTAGLLLIFLTYPLGLGLWLSLTDTIIGQPGEYIGLDNFTSLFDDPVFWGAVWYTIFYTAVATAGKFLLGLWLALLLNHHLPFKAFIRAIVLLPWIVPTVLSSIAWWWIYDPQFSIVSYVLVNVLHLRDHSVAILTELVTGDVYQWGSLMAGLLLGSVQVAIIYSFFVECYVSSMTCAVKQ